MQALYVGTNTPVADIGRKFGRSAGWLSNFAKSQGWPQRGKDWRSAKALKPTTAEGSAVRNPVQRKPRTQGQITIDRRTEENARERELYGALRDDVAYLRRLGWIINRERDGFLVGNTVCTAAELHAKAERERRLEQPAPAVIARTGRHAVTPSAPGVPVRPKPEPPKPPAGICDRCGGPRSIMSARLCRACYAPAKPTPVADRPATSGAALCSCGQPKGDVRSPRCRACYLAIKARAAL